MPGNAKLRKVSAKIKTPFFEIAGDWEADESDQKAAWELYVELVTRIAVQELKPGEGSLREALSSLHDIFDETRKILRQYGPSIGKPKSKGTLTLGTIALKVLNEALRPFLSKWHPKLKIYEEGSRESSWHEVDAFRDELKMLNVSLKEYSNHLADVAGVPGI